MATIVIVDDQFTSRRIQEELVSNIEENLTVQSFADPQAALNWLQDATPDLILTDFRMPNMDGGEFTRRVRQFEHCLDVPILVVTALEDRSVRYEALSSGATDFLTKPLDHIECRARCKNLLMLGQQQRIIKDRSKWLEQQVEIATREIRARETETLLRLGRAGDFRDKQTSNHVLRMARYSRLIAEQLGRTQAECDFIEQAAPLHDIGKIGIPDSILLKQDGHTPEETEIMRKHPEIGYEILKDSPSRYLQMGALVALTHHERFDGTGYPKGLYGEAIPIAARIVAVADVFDALTSARPYKPAWPVQDALDFMEKERGQHFDPQCLDAFIARIDDVYAIMETCQDPDVTQELCSTR